MTVRLIQMYIIYMLKIFKSHVTEEQEGEDFSPNEKISGNKSKNDTEKKSIKVIYYMLYLK